MKLTKQVLTKLFSITREELGELDLPAGAVELSEAIEAYIAHRIESKSQSSLRRKLEWLRAQLYATQAERIYVSNRLLRSESLLIDDYRRVTQFRIVAGRSALLAIAARVAFIGQAGTTAQYLARLAKELEDVRVALPSYEQRDFAPGSDLVALLKPQEDVDAA